MPPQKESMPCVPSDPPFLWAFYGICGTHSSTFECVKCGTFYGILMLNMTAILYLFYLHTHTPSMNI